MSILKAGRPINKIKALEQLMDEEDPLIRVNFRTKRSIYKKVKKIALEKDILIGDLLNHLITKTLEEEEKV